MRERGGTGRLAGIVYTLRACAGEGAKCTAPPVSRALVIVLCVVACKKAAPAAPPKPARYCDQDISGVWLNANDKHFAYRFRDHGDIVRGEFVERKDDATLSIP